MLEIYCCYCFNDACLISYENDDVCNDLYKRLKLHIQNQFELKKRLIFVVLAFAKLLNIEISDLLGSEMVF